MGLSAAGRGGYVLRYRGPATIAIDHPGRTHKQ